MLAEEELDAPSAPDGLTALIPHERMHDPGAYVVARRAIIGRGISGDLKPIDAQRLAQMLETECLAATGVAYDDAAKLGRDPLLNLAPIMDRCEEELRGLEQAVADVDTMRLDPEKKKRWMNLIKRVLIMQGICRADAAKFWLYVGKDDNPNRAGQRMVYAQCHVDMFSIWNDTEFANSLIEAPVGHGKSTCMRGQIAWEIGTWPELRHLYMTESSDLAEDTVRAIRAIVTSNRFRAMFPDVRLLKRTDRAEDSARKFTVGRKNVFARDATIIAAGYLSSIQGSRFDRIWGDDVCPPAVKEHSSMRDQINGIWDGVVRTRVADPRNSRTRLIGTPWHAEDVLAHTAKRVFTGELLGWRVEIDPFRIYIDPATDRPVPLWKENWPVTVLENIRRTSPTWKFTHELRFDDDSGGAITRVHYYNSRPEMMDDGDRRILDEIETGERWLSIDPAGTGNAWSSGQGVVEFVLTGRGHLFIPNCWFWHCTLPELMDHIVDVMYDGTQARGTRFTGTHWEVQGGTAVYAAAGLTYFRNLLEEKGIHGIQIRQTGTRIGGTKQNLGKKGRLENASPYIQRGFVRLAGERTERPEGSGTRRFLRAKPGTNVAKLAKLLMTWDGDPRTSDCIDATSQFIIDKKHRLVDPFLEDPIKAADVVYTPMQLAHKESMDRLFGDGNEPEPLDEEDRFLASLNVA